MNIVALRDACVALLALCKSTNLNLRCTEFVFCARHGSHQTNLLSSKFSSLQGRATLTNIYKLNPIPLNSWSADRRSHSTTTTTQYVPLQEGGQVKSLFLALYTIQIETKHLYRDKQENSRIKTGLHLYFNHDLILLLSIYEA